MSWYAIQISRGARGAKAAAIACKEAGVFARVPLIRQTQQPILPGYVLLQADEIETAIEVLREHSVAEQLLGRGLRTVYAAGLEAGIVTNGELAVIDRIEAEGSGLVQGFRGCSLEGLEPGDVLEIKAGPLAGCCVAFAKWTGSRGTWRLVVQLQSQGLVATVTLSPEQAERVRKIAHKRRK